MRNCTFILVQPSTTKHIVGSVMVFRFQTSCKNWWNYKHGKVRKCQILFHRAVPTGPAYNWSSMGSSQQRTTQKCSQHPEKSCECPSQSLENYSWILLFQWQCLKLNIIIHHFLKATNSHLYRHLEMTTIFHTQSVHSSWYLSLCFTTWSIFLICLTWSFIKSSSNSFQWVAFSWGWHSYVAQMF